MTVDQEWNINDNVDLKTMDSGLMKVYLTTSLLAGSLVKIGRKILAAKPAKVSLHEVYRFYSLFLDLFFSLGSLAGFHVCRLAPPKFSTNTHK